MNLKKHCEICGKEVTSETAKIFDKLGVPITVCFDCMDKYNEIDKKRTIDTFKKLIE